MSRTTTLSSKNLLYIPKTVRDEQRWKAGQELAFIPKGKGVLIVPAPERNQLQGIAEGANSSDYRDREDRF